MDATYLNVRNSVSQPASMATVGATGVTADGNREILGCDVGDSEGFWQQFMRALRDRDLSGVRLVISDAHRGLAAAASRRFQGEHRLTDNLLAVVPRTHLHMAAALFRTMPDCELIPSSLVLYDEGPAPDPDMRCLHSSTRTSQLIRTIERMFAH